jgi:hypothetical protein
MHAAQISLCCGFLIFKIDLRESRRNNRDDVMDEIGLTVDDLEAALQTVTYRARSCTTG